MIINTFCRGDANGSPWLQMDNNGAVTQPKAGDPVGSPQTKDRYVTVSVPYIPAL